MGGVQTFSIEELHSLSGDEGGIDQFFLDFLDEPTAFAAPLGLGTAPFPTMGSLSGLSLLIAAADGSPLPLDSPGGSSATGSPVSPFAHSSVADWAAAAGSGGGMHALADICPPLLPAAPAEPVTLPTSPAAVGIAVQASALGEASGSGTGGGGFE